MNGYVLPKSHCVVNWQYTGFDSPASHQVKLIVNMNRTFVMASVIPKQRKMSEAEHFLWFYHRLGQDGIFQIAYVPFVIANLVWDYADTVTRIAAMLRLGGAKKLSRRVKELKVEYDRTRLPYLDAKHQDSEIENGYIFEDAVNDITQQLLKNITFDLRCEYPNLDPEHLDFLIAVYQCDIMLNALMEYSRIKSNEVSYKLNLPSIGRMLPDAIYKLVPVMPRFAGDKPLSVEFGELRKRYIKTYASQMSRIEVGDCILDFKS